MTSYSPTIRRRRLSAALRQLRLDRGMSAEMVARKAGWDPSKISRIESDNWKRPRIADIQRLSDIYQVDPETREALITLARQARQRGWWEQYRDVLGDALPGLEAEAVSIHSWQPMLIPGLLQTPDYIRAICRASNVCPAETERRVDARLERQRILEAPSPPMLRVVVDESALRKPVGGLRVMVDQVRHLVEMSERENVRIQVLRDAVGAHPGMTGSFVILGYAGGQSVVYVETTAGAIFVDAETDVTKFQMLVGDLMAAASSLDESREYLQSVLESLKGSENGSVW